MPDKKRKFETKVHRKTLNPFFNENFSFKQVGQNITENINGEFQSQTFKNLIFCKVPKFKAWIALKPWSLISHLIMLLSKKV
jgi:hypothetical protein